MEKNFDNWNKRKKEINSEEPNFYHEIISQVRLIDTKRLHDRLIILNKEKFDEIRKAVRDLI